MKKILIITLLAVAILSGCRKPPPDPGPGRATIQELARDGLYEVMQDAYLWYYTMPNVNLEEYPGPEYLLEALRYREKDPWSFVTSYQAFMASMQGSFVGHGIRMGLDTDNNVRVVSLYKRPDDLWSEGVRRGWIVKEINGTPIAPIFISGNNSAYDNLMGPPTAGVTNSFRFITPEGEAVTINSTKRDFIINSVTEAKVLDTEGGKTGYLCFETFIDPSEQELNDAFAMFKAANVTDLIIDLRYNGGGYMDIAQQLASLVISPDNIDKVCYKLVYNNKMAPGWNESFNFIETESPLGLDRVVFITTRSSASASEVVINSLKPFIDVKIVGDATHGKPAGMNVFGFPFAKPGGPTPDYRYVFAPITFEYLNADDEGRFYGGMEPDVFAADDVTHDFGDPEEASLKAALDLLQGRKAAPALRPEAARIWSEGDQLPNDLILGPPQRLSR